MNVLFFGTPHVAVPFLDWLYQNQMVVGVVCQPDRPSGRGYDVVSPPTKTFALKNSLPVFQPEGAWTPDVLQGFKKTNADVGIVVAYGRIIPESVFTAPKKGCLNIHFSLLPRYRGAAPIQWALINGERETGVSAFWLDQGMDTGPLSHQQSCTIEDHDDAISLREKMISIGIQVLDRFFQDLSQNKIIKTPQRGEPVMAPLLKKETGKIKWAQSPVDIQNLIRGVIEWPGAWTEFHSAAGKKQLKIFKSVPSTASGFSAKQPGTVVAASADQGIVVQTRTGTLSLLEVQPEGKKRMPAWDFWQGARLNLGEQFL